MVDSSLASAASSPQPFRAYNGEGLSKDAAVSSLHRFRFAPAVKAGVLKMETNIETHLAMRHDTWRPMMPEVPEDSPPPDSRERDAALEALHSKLHEAEECDHSAESR